MSSNPVFPGWYADPELHYFDGKYCIYPTISAIEMASSLISISCLARLDSDSKSRSHFLPSE